MLRRLRHRLVGHSHSKLFSNGDRSDAEVPDSEVPDSEVYEPYFQHAFYLSMYGDVRELRSMTPFDHFCRIGEREGRMPNPFFDGRWYLDRNPDVADAGKPPLRHFIEYGSREGRDPSPLFETNWYRNANPDVAASDIEPLRHFLEHGAAEGRRPLPISLPPADLRGGELPVAGDTLKELALFPEGRAITGSMSPDARTALENLIKRFAEPEADLISLSQTPIETIAAYSLGYSSAATAWERLYGSLTDSPATLVIVGGIERAEMLERCLSVCRHTSEPSQSMLLLAVDEAAVPTDTEWLADFPWRSLAEFEPSCDPFVRTQLVTAFIRFLMPSRALLLGHSYAWRAIEKHGTALAQNTKLLGILAEENNETWALRNLRTFLPSLTSICLPAHVNEAFRLKIGAPPSVAQKLADCDLLRLEASLRDLLQLTSTTSN